MFRRHVGKGSLDHPGTGQASGEGGRVGLEEFGDAKVQNLESAVGRETKISGLQVSMQDALLMRRRNSRGHLDAKLENLIDWKRPGRKLLSDGVARKQLHRQEIGGTRAVEIVNCRNVGMVQPGKDLCFQLEVSAGVGIDQGAGRKNFQSNEPIQALVVSTIDDAHSAGTDPFHDTIMP